MRRLLFLSLATTLVISACGGDGAGDETTTTATTTTTTTTTSAPTTTGATTTTAPPTTTTTTPTTTTTSGPTTTTLPGEPFELYWPAGAVLGVFGVAHDDVLNVRAAPGIDQAIVTTLEPLADDVISLGRGRKLTQSIWIEIAANGIVGWANVRYLIYLGGTDDMTAQVVDILGEYPAAETMQDLGLIVAEALAPTDEEVPTSIVMSVAPTVGDLGEVTYDLGGLADDAQWGYRLHVFGTPTEGGEGFVLMSVEATAACTRGVTDEGYCI